MDRKFQAAVEALHPSFLRLRDSLPIRPKDVIPHRGVYLFSEGDNHLYVGRSNSIPARYRNHCRPGATHTSAAFAMLLAREQTGMYASYRKGTGRSTLMQHENFRPAFDQAKMRIAAMEFRAVEETDQTRQALLEIYVAVALATRYNDFGTH